MYEYILYPFCILCQSILLFLGNFGELHKEGVVILNTFDKIDILLKQQKKKQIQLTDFLGLNKNAYSDWKIGRTTSYTKHLSRIAEFFGVTVDYLLGKEEKPSAPYGTNGFSDELLQKIAQLDELDRIKTDAFVSGLLAAEKYQEPTQILKIAARGGGVKEITVTDSQLKAIMNLPEVKNLGDDKS